MRTRCAAFTLVELLVVIAIICILAALLLPVFGLMRKQADSTQCVAQLGSIGTAIAAYVNDHEGVLPGPLTMKQSAAYDTTTRGSLAQLLESYLGSSPGIAADGSSGTAREVAAFLCPAAVREKHDRTLPTYLANQLPLPSFNQSGWGDIALGQEPLRQSALTNWTDAKTGGHPLNLAELWAIKDADQAYFKQATLPSESIGELLPEPAHGNHRNALFHDFHVGRVQVITVVIPKGPPPEPADAKEGSGR